MSFQVHSSVGRGLSLLAPLLPQGFGLGEGCLQRRDMSFQELDSRAFVYGNRLRLEIGLQTSLESLGEVWIS